MKFLKNGTVNFFTKQKQTHKFWNQTDGYQRKTMDKPRMGFPHSSVGKESICSAGDSGSIPGLGRCTGEGIGYSLQYFGASLVAQLVKNLPAIWEIWAKSLGWEDHGKCKTVGNIMWNARPDEAQAGIKIARRNINNLRYADDTTIMSESKEELKSLWWKWKRSEKAGLKLNIQKTKIMASGPITSWKIDGETMEIVRNFIFLGSKITADGDCSHEIKRRLLLGRKAMAN